MATITITVPDAVAPRVLDAVAATYGWDANMGLTKAQFAKKWLQGQLQTTVKNYETGQAQATARVAAETAVDTDIVLT